MCLGAKVVLLYDQVVTACGTANVDAAMGKNGSRACAWSAKKDADGHPNYIERECEAANATNGGCVGGFETKRRIWPLCHPQVAHECRRMQTVNDGRSKEARSGGTVERLPLVRPASFNLHHARPQWPLRSQRSKQKEALEATAGWPSSTRRHGSGLQCLVADPCRRARWARPFSAVVGARWIMSDQLLRMWRSITDQGPSESAPDPMNRSPAYVP
jgi:hypothetical protein